MVTLSSYRNPGEASLAQSLLEASGIPAVLEHEQSVVLSPVGAGAIRLQVPPDRVTEAQQILAAQAVEFVRAPDTAPRFGFWRGSAGGLLIGSAVVLVPRIVGYHWPLPPHHGSCVVVRRYRRSESQGSQKDLTKHYSRKRPLVCQTSPMTTLAIGRAVSA